MKRMKYITLIVMIMMTGIAFAAHRVAMQPSARMVTSYNQPVTLTHQPTTQMQSTSVMPSTGSSLPISAVSGVSTTEGNNSCGMTGPRRIGGGNSGGGDDGPEDNEDPWKTPLGDALLPLLLLASGYGFFIARKRRALKKSN